MRTPTRDSVRRRPLLHAIFALLALWLALQPTGVGATSVSGAEGVNIRSCAALECDVVGIAKLGDDLQITGAAVDGFTPVQWGNVSGFAYSLYVPADGSAPWFREGDRTCQRVALVFNIGIGGEPSWSILDTLTAADADASFFPMGWWAADNSDYLESIAESGWTIGTHGDQQRFLTDFDDATIARDIADSEEAIERVIGRDIDRWYTPYAADIDDRVRGIAAGLGFMPVGWTVAAADYDETATADGVYARVMDNVHPGALIELHLDGPATETSTAAILPQLIDDLRAEGYDLVTVPELAMPCGYNASPDEG